MKPLLIILLTAFPCISTAATFDITFEKFGLVDWIHGDGETIDRYLTNTIQVEINKADAGGYTLFLDPDQDFPFYYNFFSMSTLTTETHFVPGQSTQATFLAKEQWSSEIRRSTGFETRHSLSFSDDAIARFLSLEKGQHFETEAQFSAYDLTYTQRDLNDYLLGGTGRVTVQALSAALIAPVPLPNSAILIMLGLASFLGLRRVRS